MCQLLSGGHVLSAIGVRPSYRPLVILLADIVNTVTHDIFTHDALELELGVACGLDSLVSDMIFSVAVLWCVVVFLCVVFACSTCLCALACELAWVWSWFWVWLWFFCMLVCVLLLLVVLLLALHIVDQFVYIPPTPLLTLHMLPHMLHHHIHLLIPNYYMIQVSSTML